MARAGCVGLLPAILTLALLRGGGVVALNFVLAESGERWLAFMVWEWRNHNHDWHGSQSWGGGGWGGGRRRGKWRDFIWCSCGNWVYTDRNLQFCRACGKELQYPDGDEGFEAPEVADADVDGLAASAGDAAGAVAAAGADGLRTDERLRAASLLLQQDPRLAAVAKHVEGQRQTVMGKRTLDAALTPSQRELFNKSTRCSEDLHKALKTAEKKGAALAAKAAALRRQLSDVEQNIKTHNGVLATARTRYEEQMRKHWNEYPSGCPLDESAPGGLQARSLRNDNDLDELLSRLRAQGDEAGIALLGRYFHGGPGAAPAGPVGVSQVAVGPFQVPTVRPAAGLGHGLGGSPFGPAPGTPLGTGPTMASTPFATAAPSTGVGSAATTVAAGAAGTPGHTASQCSGTALGTATTLPAGDGGATAPTNAAGAVRRGASDHGSLAGSLVPQPDGSHARYPEPYSLGQRVQVFNLLTEAAQRLNNSIGEVVGYGVSNGAWRVALQLHAFDNKRINLKLSNVRPLPRELVAAGELEFPAGHGGGGADAFEEPEDSEALLGFEDEEEEEDVADIQAEDRGRRAADAERPDAAKKARGDVSASSTLASAVRSAVEQSARS